MMMEVRVRNLQNDWKEFILLNDFNMQVNVLNFGGIITKLFVPDKYNRAENVVLGYKNYKDYEMNPNYFGAIIGPVAGRIKHGTFTLNGKTYRLEPNDGKHLLHSGRAGFHQVIWDVEPFQRKDRVGIILRHTLNEEIFPGNIQVEVAYTLTNSNELILNDQAKCSNDTIFTMTNHSYFNLSGNLKETIHNHYVTFESDSILELDEALIPTGNLMNVTKTTFDFRHGRKLGDGLTSDHPQHIIASSGYDHYFIFNQKDENIVNVLEPNSGRKLTITTDDPGMVMYTANTLDDNSPLFERYSEKYLGVCFETQAPPASLIYEWLPTIVLKKGEIYKKKTVYAFGVENN